MWLLKRHFWQIALTVCFLGAITSGSIILQSMLAPLLIGRIFLDLWRFVSFSSYQLIDPQSNTARTWQSIAEEFRTKQGRIAFYGIQRNSINALLLDIMQEGKITQSDNNLCGPVAFLNFLIKHDPALFAKTFCEYFENGCTYSPFYLQSSFWDRYAYFTPIGLINRLFRNHYTDPFQALAGAFKNTANLMGYSNSCLFETFKGSTEPKQIIQWLEQAGFASTSCVTVNNYNNSGEMPWLFRLLVGGIYTSNNRTLPPAEHSDEYSYIELTQRTGSSPLHFMFNVASGHWTWNSQRRVSENFIQIHNTKRNITT